MSITGPHKRGTFQDWQQRSEVFQTIAMLLASHGFEGDKGLCTDLGKHEDNPMQTLYFNEAILNGDGEVIGEGQHIVDATLVEQDIFGAMDGCTQFLVTEDDNGFVYGEWIWPARAEKLRSDAIEDTDNAE